MTLALCPGLTTWVLKAPVSEVAVCDASELFVHVTLEPADTVSVFGLKQNPETVPQLARLIIDTLPPVALALNGQARAANPSNRTTARLLIRIPPLVELARKYGGELQMATISLVTCRRVGSRVPQLPPAVGRSGGADRELNGAPGGLFSRYSTVTVNRIDGGNSVVR